MPNNLSISGVSTEVIDDARIPILSITSENQVLVFWLHFIRLWKPVSVQILLLGQVCSMWKLTAVFFKVYHMYQEFGQNERDWHLLYIADLR